MRWSRRATVATFLLALLPSAVRAQAPLRKIGEMEVSLVGLRSTVDPLNPTVPKNTASGVRVVVTAGARELSAAEVMSYFGVGFQVQGLLSGPGLPTAVDLPHLREGESLPADPLLLPLPALPQAGDYHLTNVRISGNGKTIDVDPQTVIVKVIDQILVTSVKTRALTLDEIKAKGIVLDSDAYLGFEFTLGLKLESNPVNISFPVVFDRQGVPVPQPIQPPPSPDRTGIPLPPMPTIVPMLLEMEVGDGDGAKDKIPITLANGQPIRIPSVLVIPGNVGYLKQFFSAQLFVANGAPVGTNLVVRDVKGTIHLPFGKDTIEGPDPNNGINDDPLALPKILRDSEEIPQPPTMDILGVGPDGIPGTPDDTTSFNPGEQGQAEFLVRGEKEGFHTLDFDIAAMLDGLPVGPVKVTGKASGGVLVRNPNFNMTFTVPSVARRGEDFTLFITVSNVGQGAANLLKVKLDNPAISGIEPAVIDKLAEPPTLESGERTIPTLAPGDSKTLSFRYKSNVTGKVVASYLAMDLGGANNATGTLRFSLGVGERGVPLSPDTLVLPSAVDLLPIGVVEAAMRVLGQGWSLANAPAATLPKGVLRTSRDAVTQKALALAEAGLRTNLGQPEADAIRDLAFEFYGGEPLDPGFDQLLRQTEAGDELALALGNAMKTASDDAGGALAYEGLTAESGSPSGEFVSFGITGPVGVTLSDGAGRKTIAGVRGGTVPGAVFLPLGPGADAGRFAIVTSPVGSPYVLELNATGEATAGMSATFPRGDGSFAHVEVPAESLAAGGRARLTVDFADPASVVLELDPEGDGTFTSQTRPTTAVTPPGPHAISANIIGPETFDSASPFGLQAVVLFDRRVDAAEAAVATHYVVPANKVQAARAQLSGRIVFLSLARPEGPYFPTTLTVSGMSDRQGRPGATETATVGVRLKDPGAVVTGRVMNADGTPVSLGFMTYLNQLDWTCNNPSEGALAAIPIAGDGRYEIRYVRQDNCGAPFKILTVDPNSGSLRTLTRHVRAAGEQIVLDVVLFGRGSVTGIVKQNGAAVAGAKVAAFSGTDPLVGGTATTAADGRYTINGMTVGPVTVRAAKGLSVGQAAGRVERAGTAATIDVNLEGETVRISGKVTKLEDGKTTVLPGVYVYYYLAGYGAPMGFAQTDAEGDYELSGLPAGAYTVSAALNQRDQASAQGISAPRADIVHNLVIAIAPPSGFGTVTGVVKLPSGQPAGGVVVAVGDRGVLSDETTGAFTIPGVAVQPNQSVSARTRDGRRSGSTSFSIFEPGAVVNTSITLSGLGSIVFTVVDPANQPIQGIFVRRLAACADPCGCAIASTDSQGRVRFDDVGLGGMAVQAIRTGSGAVDVASASASVTRDGEEAFAVMRFNGSGTVVGKVLNPDGTPSFGADVALSSTFFYNDGAFTCGLIQGVSHRARTDQSGEFRFTGVNVGPVSVTASQPFFPTQVGQSGTLGANGQQVRFDLKLVNTISGELTGTVYLPDGVTPAGAGVDVSAVGPLPEVAVKTNDQGFYRFPKIFPEGTYSITTSDKVSGGVAREQVYLRAGQDSLHNQRLKGTGTVRVRVVNALDVPVTTAFVRLRETDFPNGAYERAIEASNEGVATFETVFEGPFNVEVSDPLARGGRFSSVLPHAGDTVEVKVRMTVTGTVQGRFLMPDGVTPIPFGSVTLSAGGRVVGQTTTRGTDPVGSFSFAYVPAGDVRVEAQDPLTARAGVAVGRLENEGDVVTLDVKAQGLGTVQGTVFSNGVGQDQAHVEIVSGSYRAGTTTDASGHYLVRGVPEGAVFVNAALPNGFLSGSGSGGLSGDAADVIIDVNLRDSGGLTGHVLNPDESVAPLSIVTVQVGGTGGGTFSTTTDAQGQFAFTKLPAGTANLTANAIGSIDQGAITTDVPSAATRDVIVRLNGTGSIQGHTLNSEGDPIAGNLWLQGTGRFGWGVFLQVGNDGFFRVPNVLAGAYTASLTAQAGNFTLYGTASGDIAPGEQEEVDVKVQDSGTVTGIVLRSDGATPAAGSRVTVRLDPFRGAVALQAQSDGRFTARGVPLGAFSVLVSDPVTTGVALLTNQDLAANGNTADVGSIVLDDTPVSVLAVDPPGGSTGVLVGRPIVFTLSDPIQSANGYVSARTASGQGAISFGLALSADGRTLTVNPQNTWPDSQEVILTLGTGVTDIFGRHLAQSYETRFRTVDLSPPAVASIVPANGAIQVDASATVVVTFNDDLAPTQDVSGLVVLSRPLGAVAGTVSRTAPNAVTFVPASALDINSSYSIAVNGATDVSGNTQTVPFGSAFKTLDTVPPVLTLSAPPSGAWIKVKRPELVLILTDSLSGVDPNTKGLSFDDAAVTPGGAANTLQFTPAADLSDGEHHFTATVNDRAGNPGSTSGSFNVDTELPGAAWVTGFVDGQVISGTITIGGSATDAPSGVQRIEIFADGVLIANAFEPSFTASYNTNALSEGPHTFTARATDRAGNVGAIGSPVTVVVDNKQITVLITKPEGVNPRFASSVFVKAIASEPIQSMDFTVSSGGTPLFTVTDGSNPYEVTIDVSAVPEGVARITATAHGQDTQSAFKDIVVDRTAPAAPDASKIAAEESDGDRALVLAQAGGAEALTSIEVTTVDTGAKSSTIAAADGSFALLVRALVDQAIEIVAIDAAGNRSTATTVAVVRKRTSGGVPLSGLKLWVKADSEGIVKDASGLVSLWPDQTPSGTNNMNQAAPGAQPRWIADGINGLPVLRFDGGDLMQFASQLPSVRSVFWVIREDGTASDDYRFLLHDCCSNDFHGGSPRFLWYTGASAHILNGQTWLNGTAVDGTTTNRPRTMSVLSIVTTGPVTADRFGSGNGSGRSWLGDLAELIIYDQPLNGTDRKAVEDYLALKYGLYVPTVGTPTISPTGGGSFSGSTTVTLSTATPAASIYYTTDGTEPSTSSTLYTGPFTLTQTRTIKAKAFRTGLYDSAAAVATFVREEDFSPGSVSNMTLWFRADAGLTTDSGGRVSLWTDQSGNLNDGRQTVSALQPRLVPDAANGLPALHFDGNDVVNFTSRLVSNIRTVFWVIREDATAPDEYHFLLHDCCTTDFHGNYPRAIWYPGASPNIVNGQTWLDGVPIDGTVTNRPRTMSVLSVVTTGPVSADRFGSGNGPGRYWWGDLAELVIYDRALSMTERKGVEDYLRNKYRIGVAVTAPVISPSGGVFTDSVEVTLATPTPGAEIFYTIDGTEPTTSSSLYTGPLTLTSTAVLKAKAFVADYGESVTVTSGFTKSTDFHPQSLSGLQLWLRADAGVPTGYGDVWEDQSGNHNDATQANGVAIPRVVPDAANGLPALHFDGNDVVNFTSRLVSNIRTVFWVIREDATAPDEYHFLLHDCCTTDFHGNYPRAIWYPGASPNVINGQTWLNGVPIDGRVTNRPRTLSVLSLVTTGPVSADRFGSGNGPGRHWWGDLAELVIYDRALSMTERKAVEDYLRNKYRIGVAVTAPLVSPHGGVFTDSVAVTLATPTPGAQIFYTADGTEPTTSSSLYTGPLTVTSTAVLKAKAFVAGYGESVTVTSGFTKSTDFHPRSLTGLQLWLRADAGVPTGYGDVWEDQSGNHNHATQAYGVAIPRVVPDAANGLPALHFDGNDAVNFTSRLVSNIRTVFWVIREDATAPDEYHFLLHDCCTTDFHGNYPRAIWYPGASSYVVNGDTWLDGVLINGTVTNRPRTLSVLSVVTTGPVTADRFGSGNGLGRYWWGDLAELVIYDRPLDATERKKVEDYLRIKYWGVTAAPGNHQVTLSWPLRPGAAPVKYDVERSTTSGSGYAPVATALTGTSFTNTGLDDETTYFYRVVAVDATGTRFPSREVVGTPLRIGTGAGLTGAYYNNTTLSGPPVLTRTDPVVNFNFGSGSPDAAVSADNFSARWTGEVLAPVTRDYTFATNSDDGVRLRVNGQLVIDNWTIHGDTFNTSLPVPLTAGERYDISLEFFEGGGGAVVRLQWSYPGQTLQAIPTSQLYPPVP